MTLQKAGSDHGDAPKEVIQDLGWGRLVFGQTFDDPGELGTALRAEASGRRDIGMYLEAPHVFVRGAAGGPLVVRPEPGSGGEPTRFGELAVRLWAPLLDHERQDAP